MKIAASLLLLASASATLIRDPSKKLALLSKARRLEDAAGDDAAEQSEYAFLSKYNIKMINCVNGETWVDPQDGASEYSSVVFRLCPADSCSSDTSSGCKDGYGDFVVGLNTYVNLWLEAKRDDMYVDDNFKIEQASECREYKADKNNGGNNNGEQYYVGPTCSADGKGVNLAMFSDETCTTVPEDVTFEDISNGWTLPFSDSSLVTTSCEQCTRTDDNGNTEINDMCIDLYENAGKCESKMSKTSANGADESGCEYISSLLPKTQKSGKAGAAVGWTILALVIVGVAGYAYATWWMKKKQGGMASDGVMN